MINVSYILNIFFKLVVFPRIKRFSLVFNSIAILQPLQQFSGKMRDCGLKGLRFKSCSVQFSPLFSFFQGSSRLKTKEWKLYF